jgi:hypothetical protein
VYEIDSKIFYLSRNFVSGGVALDLDKYLFPWQTFTGEGTSSIKVILHSGKYDTSCALYTIIWMFRNNLRSPFISIRHYYMKGTSGWQ